LRRTEPAWGDHIMQPCQDIDETTKAKSHAAPAFVRKIIDDPSEEAKRCLLWNGSKRSIFDTG